MKVAIYVRVSTKKQETEMQEEALLKYCTSKNQCRTKDEPEWTGFTIYRDVRTGKDANRNSFQTMMEDVAKGEIDVIMIYKLDRIFRSLSHMLTLLEAFQKANVTLISSKENLDTSTPMGRFFVHLLASLAEFESDQMGDRIKDGVKNAKENGNRKDGSKWWWKPPKIPVSTLVELHKTKTIREIALQVGLNQSTVGKHLKLAALG